MKGNKICVFVMLIVLMYSCSSAKYLWHNTESHIIITDKGKNNVFDEWGFSVPLTLNDFNFNIWKTLSATDIQVLKAIKYNIKEDSILYAGQGTLLVLKNQNVDLSSFRIINLYDSTLAKIPYNHWTVNFYRKTIIVPKSKLFIINDLIPYGGKYFQRVEYLKTDDVTIIDPTNADDIVHFADTYQNAIRLTKETYLNILQKKIIEVKNPYLLFEDKFKKDKILNYRAAYILEDYANNYYTPENKGFFDQMLATYYSFADNISKSDSVWKELMQLNDTCNCVSTGNYDDLLKKIANHQVVMFNEAHHIPKHRLLVYNLLDTLYNQGFRYLALEVFTGDSLFYQTGFVSANNGYYLREPVFANLVRKAYKTGFKIIGYDAMGTDRNKLQAENIYNQTLKQDSMAKIFVLAGWGNIDKNAMPNEFKKISGIKPLTADQTFSYNNCSKSNKSNEIVLIEPTNQSINTDIYIFNNLNFLNTKNTKISIPENIKDYCQSIGIYNKNEFDFLSKNNKISIPICVITDTNDPKNLEIDLQQGEYYLIFQDDFGNILEQKTIQII